MISRDLARSRAISGGSTTRRRRHASAALGCLTDCSDATTAACLGWCVHVSACRPRVSMHAVHVSTCRLGALVHVNARVDALIDGEILPLLNGAVARAFAFVAAAPDALRPVVDTAEVASTTTRASRQQQRRRDSNSNSSSADHDTTTTTTPTGGARRSERGWWFAVCAPRRPRSAREGRT